MTSTRNVTSPAGHIVYVLIQTTCTWMIVHLRKNRLHSFTQSLHTHTHTYVHNLSICLTSELNLRIITSHFISQRRDVPPILNNKKNKHAKLLYIKVIKVIMSPSQRFQFNLISRLLLNRKAEGL